MIGTFPIPNNLAIMEREENMGEGSAVSSASANGAMTFQHPFWETWRGRGRGTQFYAALLLSNLNIS